ncbi:MAG: protein kinase [Myxococcales bacterium]|nr:protein kinase [Myxococcales bacterium]
MKKPTLFGKYLLLERLNVGGMAEVFTAKAFGVEGFERILAIKKILPTMAEDEEFITMFIDEARISVQLNHANVVHIHELGKHDEAYYIAMEYVSGKDLRALLERFRRRREIMPTAMAVFVASKMCEGLDYAHRKKDARGQELHIIHRDVSPQNILLSYEGEVKIIDFGIAKAANRSQKTQAGILKGKFGYMSPEQVRGQPIDRRSDIFAVGVTLYEMLTGEKLFVGESDFSTLEKVRNAEVPLPRQFNPNIPAGLEKVVLKSLAREVEDRYQWSSDLQEDLMRFLLAGDAIYSGKHLSAYMKEAFAEDLYREAEKMERYASVSKPEDLENSGITAGPKKKAAAAAAPPPAPAPPSRSRSSQLVNVGGGAGAVAMGPQNTSVNIPPPTADELAEMDGSADRTIIMPSGSAAAAMAAARPASAEVDLKTAIGLPSPFNKPQDNGPASGRQQLRPSSVRPPPGAGTSTTHDNLGSSTLSALSGNTANVTMPPKGPVRDDDTGNDLKPIEMTGFRPALDVDEDGNEIPPEELNATMAPSRPSRPKVVIGDAPVNGATTVGPSPLSANETMLPASTRAFESTDDDVEPEPEPADEEPVDDEPSFKPAEHTAQRPAVKRATPAPRPQTRRQPANRAKQPSGGKKPGVMIAIGALAVIAVLVVGAAAYKLTAGNKARLLILVKPKVPFTATISGKTYDGSQAIELDPGKHTVTLKPAKAGYGRQQFSVDVAAGKINQFEVLLVADERPTDPAATPEPKGTDPTAPDPKLDPKGVATADPKADPKTAEPKAPDSKTADPKADPKTADPKVEAPKPWAATISAEEAGVEISLDGKVRGTTPDVKVAELVPGKTYRGLAKKKGFITETFTVENPGAESSVTVTVSMKPEATVEKKDPPPVVTRKDPPPAVVKKDPPPPQPKTEPKNDPPPAKNLAKGQLKIASNPTGAEVIMDGKPTGRKTPILPADPLLVSVGKHKFQFKLNGKMSAPVEVTVVEGANPVIRGDIPQ